MPLLRVPAAFAAEAAPFNADVQAKSEKEETKAKKEVLKAIQKGNKEIAQVHAQNAIRHKVGVRLSPKPQISKPAWVLVPVHMSWRNLTLRSRGAQHEALQFLTCATTAQPPTAARILAFADAICSPPRYFSAATRLRKRVPLGWN